MLADDQLHLLTAAVDGELTPREARLLRQLLAASPAAVTLFAQLQADRDRLRALPAAQVPADLSGRIAAGLATLPPHGLAVPSEAVALAGRRRSVLPLAVAASLLLGVSALSFGFFVRTNESATRTPDHHPTVQRALLPVLPLEGEHPSKPILAEMPLAVQPRVEQSEPGPVPQPTPPDREFVGPPAPGPSPVFVAPPHPPIAPFTTARVRLPFLTTVMDLDREDVRQQFTDELARDSAWRIDVFASDSSRGVEQFLASARANGISVRVDAVALDRIRRKQHGSFVFYSEALTAAELRELFGKLADVNARSPQRVLDSVHVLPMQTGDQKELRDLLGFDPGLGKKNGSAPMPRPEANTKPISDGTGDQVVRALTSPSGKSKEKPAVLLSLSPRANPMFSKELAEYRSRRSERKPNAVPVMIVIRTPA